MNRCRILLAVLLVAAWLVAAWLVPPARAARLGLPELLAAVVRDEEFPAGWDGLDWGDGPRVELQCAAQDEDGLRDLTICTSRPTEQYVAESRVVQVEWRFASDRLFEVVLRLDREWAGAGAIEAARHAVTLEGTGSGQMLLTLRNKDAAGVLPAITLALEAAYQAEAEGRRATFERVLGEHSPLAAEVLADLAAGAGDSADLPLSFEEFVEPIRHPATLQRLLAARLNSRGNYRQLLAAAAKSAAEP